MQAIEYSTLRGPSFNPLLTGSPVATETTYADWIAGTLFQSPTDRVSCCHSGDPKTYLAK